MQGRSLQPDSPAPAEAAPGFLVGFARAVAPPVLIEAALIAMARVGLLRGQLPWLALAWCAAFAGLALAWRFRADVFRRPATMLAWAVIFRVTLLPCVPDLSDDFYRYIWDGWLTSEGVNPFRHTPDDPALAVYARAFPFERLNSKSLHSVYPPLTQAVAAVAGRAYAVWGLDAAFLVMKSLFVMLEIGGVAGLLAASRRVSGASGSRGWQPVSLVALYAWNPLAILAIAGQGHSEAGLVLGIGVAAWAMSRGYAAASWIGLMLAALAKLTPLLAAPLWWRHWLDHRREERPSIAAGAWRIRAPGGLWAAIAMLLVFVVPFWFAGLPGNYLSSLRLYVQWFEFNGPVYGLLKAAIRTMTGYDSSKQLGPVLAAVTLLVAIWVWLLPTGWAWCSADLSVGRFHAHDRAEQTRKPNGVFDRCALIIGAFLLLATTVHPWYALAALVLVPLSPVLRWSWVWFSFASFATYFSYNARGSLHDDHGAISFFVWAGFAMIAWCEHGAALVDTELRRRGRRKARQIAPHLQGSRVLDLGCGEGFVSLALDAGRRDEGIARELFLCDVANVNRTALPGMVYDGEHLPLANASVDTVVLSLVLHHSANPRQVVREAARVARLRVIVTESTYESALDRLLIECLDRLANRLRAGEMRQQEQHLTFRKVDQWRELFEAEGLRVVQVHWLGRIIHKHVMFVLDVGRQGAGRPRPSDEPEFRISH